LKRAPIASLDVAEISLSHSEEGALLLGLSGRWTIPSNSPSFDQVQSRIEAESFAQRIILDAREVSDWDSGFLTFLINLNTYCSGRKIAIDARALPDGVHRLLELAAAVPEKKGTRKSEVRESMLAKVGNGWLDVVQAARDITEFLGESIASFGRLFVGKARFRRSDLILIIQECGVQALPIVSLISVLVGLILAFVGAVQLEQFGAQIFVANLVGIATAREMGAMMTGIIMAGRTGAAFAAQLGTMQVNEEIDALKTLGFVPMDFLVLPRMLALILMMPLLCVYSILLGILGGMIVGVGMLDLTWTQYVNQTIGALSLTDFAIGIFKAGFFGVLIAVAGCLKGIQCGRSASAVGAAATSAVVMAIILIIVADGLFAVLTNMLGI